MKVREREERWGRGKGGEGGKEGERWNWEKD